MVDYLLSGHLVDNIMIMCGENVDFLNKFPTFSLSNNCNPAPIRSPPNVATLFLIRFVASRVTCTCLCHHRSGEIVGLVTCVQFGDLMPDFASAAPDAFARNP